MPVICRFLGLVVLMYFDDHAPPHFHVKYQGFEASFDIKTLGILTGELPPRIHGKVVRWARYHQEELMTNWERCRNGQQPETIRPL